MYVIANYCNDEEIEKEYDIIDEDGDYVAINTTKRIKK